MRHDQRVFFEDGDGAVFSDFTRQLNDFRSGDLNLFISSGQDYLYIGSDYPFNAQYFEITAGNSTESFAEIDLWGGQNDGWKPAIDVIDYTSESNASLAKSGHITWTREREESWVQQDKSIEVLGLENAPLIYNFYWSRFKWSANLSNIGIRYIGNRFSTDDDLFSLYPDLNNQTMRDQWEQGSVSGTKTTWSEQSFIAAEQVIRDLRSGGILVSDSQILDFEAFRNPSIHKTAEIIYGGMGRAFAEDRIAARNSYKESLDIKNFRIDQNKDANLSRYEKRISTTYTRR
jgi:hypothetical protein